MAKYTRFVTLAGPLLAILLGSIAVAPANAQSDQPDDHKVEGESIILFESMPEGEPFGPINWGGLIIVEIPDSGSRPPRKIKVSADECLSLGSVRGVNYDKETGKPLMGGGYTWHLFKAPKDKRGVTLEASYVPNATPEPMTIKRTHVVELQPLDEE